MGTDSTTANVLSDESLVCAHMHSVARTQKDPDVHILDG